MSDIIKKQTPWAAGLTRVLAWSFVGISLIGIVIAWSFQVQMVFSWRSFFENVTEFGDHCAYQNGVHTTQDFAEILALPKSTTPVSLPFRRSGKTPIVADGGYVYVKCTVAMESDKKLLHGHYVAMNLGRLYGKSAVYLGGSLRGIFYENDVAEIPLTPTDQVRELAVEIISLKDPVSQSAGPATLLPLFVTDSTEKLRGVAYIDWFNRIQRPAFFFGWTFALFLLFFFVWIAGVRYPDIAWILIYSGALAATWLCGYSPEQKWPYWKEIAVPVFRYGAFASFAPLLYSFFRIETKAIKPEFFVPLVMVTVGILRWLLPADVWRQMGMWDYIPGLVAALACFIPGVHGYLSSKSITGPRKGRIIAVSLVAIASGPAYLAQAWFTKKSSIGVEPFMTFALLTMMAAFLVEDLVKYQRLFLGDRAQRQRDETEKNLLKENLEIGLQVQKLILPGEPSLNGALCRSTWFFQPAMGVSGDWLQIWQRDDAEVFWIGDVVGKGTQAALAVTLVAATIKRHERQTNADLSSVVESCIRDIHLVLQESFAGFINTTLSALVVRKSSTSAEVFNCAGSGFVISDEKTAQRFAPPGGLVGMGKDLVIGKVEAPLAKGMMAVSFSDGIVEGARQTRAFLGLLPGLIRAPHGDVFTRACGTRSDSGPLDDKVMVVATRL